MVHEPQSCELGKEGSKPEGGGGTLERDWDPGNVDPGRREGGLEWGLQEE